MDIPAALTIITQAIGIVRALRETDQELANAEAKAKLAEVISALADAKIALSEANEEIFGRDKEISRLQKMFQRKDELVERDGYFYSKDETGKPIGRPFCPVCVQKHGLFFHLEQMDIAGRPKVCPNCKANFGHRPAELK